MYIINFFKHFKKICVHKYWVFHYCCKAGIPLQGLTHDLSKFSPTEFFESVKYYQGTSSPIDACKKANNGYSAAWEHHKRLNKHHFEHWSYNYCCNGPYNDDMPMKYKKEMLCDYMGAGRAYHGKNFTVQKEYEWWQNRKPQIPMMYPNVMKFVDKFMTLAAADGENAAFEWLRAQK